MKESKERVGFAAVMMLFSRTLLFLAAGIGILAIFKASGAADPVAETGKWWYFQVIITNLICFLLLNCLLKMEGKAYADLLKIEKKRIKEDMKIFAVIVLPSLLLGGAGMFGGAYALYGGTAILEEMNRTPPVWAAYVVLILFPATIALTELPLYFSYSFERIEKSLNAPVLGLAAAVFFLSFQHVFIPLIFDARYMVWRFISFLPLAVFLGAVYAFKRRMLPLIAVHFLLDLQAAVMVFFLAVKK